MSTELQLFNPDQIQIAVQLFAGGGLDSLPAGIEAQVRAIDLDCSTAAGRAQIKSVAYQVVRTKTTLDAEGKKLTEEWRTATAKVNAERKKATDRLEVLAEEVRAPLTAFESKDKARVAAHEAALAELQGLSRMIVSFPQMSSLDLQAHLAEYAELYKDRDWEEFAGRATKARAETVALMEIRIAARLACDRHLPRTAT